MKKWIRSQFRKKTRVYIFPTRMGGYLNGLLFLMFLLAIGYSNNLLLIFTIFLLGLNLIWLIQTHFHLYHLRLENIQINPGHAKESIFAKVNWAKTPNGPLDWEVRIETLDSQFPLKTLVDQISFSHAEIILPRRGLYQWRYLRVSTDKPFGLYRTWIYYPLTDESIIFPPLLPRQSLELSAQLLEGESETNLRGYEDFRSLGTYDQSDSRKISWKHYARTGELLIKEGFTPISSILNLKFDLKEFQDNEEYHLSWLATQMVESYHLGIPFSFDFKGKFFPPRHDAFHLELCLRELSLC